MEFTEEQRKRSEMNRLAALERRKALTVSSINSEQQQHLNWRLSKCARPVSVSDTLIAERHQNIGLDPESSARLPEKFRVRLEICSPDSFSLTPMVVTGFKYPGEKECLSRLSGILSEVMPTHYTQNHGGGKACVYKLRDYSIVLSCLRRSKSIDVEEIPWITFAVVEKLSHSFLSGRWEPCKAEHFSDEQVESLIASLPRKLLDVLLPFQLEGLRYGLRRGGRCLIADEMGLGKTLQAIAIAGCFISEGSILVVCPAVLRFSWAEELERWLPFCLPSDIHLVFGHQNNPIYLTRWPKVVVISYTMLQHLKKTMLEREWALLIVDESHHLRCSKKKSEPNEIQTLLDVAKKAKRIILLSGTPSLSRPYDIFNQINILWPGLLGKDKYEFAKTYCAVTSVQGRQGKVFQDFSNGVRLQELNVLLKQAVMIRRLKQHVLTQLPPKRRQILMIVLKRSDIARAMTTVSDAKRVAFKQSSFLSELNEDSDEPDDAALNLSSVEDMTSNDSEQNISEDTCEMDLDGLSSDKDNCPNGKLSYQELGIAKLSGFREWLSLHPLIAEADSPADFDQNSVSNKMVIFAHHHKVLDGVQEFVCEKGIGFVRIDGTTLPRDRQSAVQMFKFSNEVKIAIIGIEAGGVGLDFSAAQNVVFLELPRTPSLMLQAEDRAHRRGQTNAVNVYIFCAKDTLDESHWKNLNKKLRRVSSATDGKYDAQSQIQVEYICYFQANDETCQSNVLENQPQQVNETVEEPLMKNCEDNRGRSGFDSDHLDDLGHKDGTLPDLGISVVHSSDKQMKSILSDPETPGTDSPSKLNDVHEGNCQPEDVGVDNGEVDSNTIRCYAHLVASLRFEVSQYTGRIHLYSCIPGKDSRPEPLFMNFRPEEIETKNPFQPDGKEMASTSFIDDSAYMNAVLEFMGEWNKLRPIEKRKLLGKPLQLPLSIELSYLNESVSHNNEGLIRGGSKRRKTPLSEISFPLPLDAVWRKVYLRSGRRKQEKEYTQAWTSTNEPLCKLCQKPCSGGSAKEPEYFEDLFCNLDCFEEYRIRTSSNYLRLELFQIEHGICTNCQLDCHQLVTRIKRLPLEKRRVYVTKVAPKVAARKNLLDTLVNEPVEGNAWHADHIIPVYRGGGECRLENMRTLCVACHADVTAAQCADRRVIRTKARKQLKSTLKNLKTAQNEKKSCSSDKKAEEEPAGQESFNEEELMIAVPGSSYSREENIKSIDDDELLTMSEQ